MFSTCYKLRQTARICYNLLQTARICDKLREAATFGASTEDRLSMDSAGRTAEKTDAHNSLETRGKTASIKDETHHARVAQLDRASVYGTEAPNPQTSGSSKTYGEGDTCACHSLCQNHAQNDPNLAAVLTAWPALPKAVKAGILAMVKVSVTK